MQFLASGTAEAETINSILCSVKQISEFLRHSPIVELDTINHFGDIQLHQDMVCDEIVEKYLRSNPFVKAFASEQRPTYQEIHNDGKFIVTYDPLDGSSIVSSNFSVGSIYSVWPALENNLIGQKLETQVNALLAIYGPRTTVTFLDLLDNHVKELTLVEDKWILSHNHLVIKPDTKIFSPGNLRAGSENQGYAKLIMNWINKGYTLRYTGGLVPDVNQIFLKGSGIFSCLSSPSHKEKLRVLYEIAAIAFLIEKAGGKTITRGKGSLMDYVIASYNDKLPFAVGSASQISSLEHLF